MSSIEPRRPEWLLQDVHGYAAARRVRLTGRAAEGLSRLGLTFDDVRYALQNATAIEPGESPRCRVEGPTRDAAARLSLTLLFWDGVLVVMVVSP